MRLLDPKTGQLLREHLRQERGAHRIPEQDKAQHASVGTLRLLARSEAAGRNIGTLCQTMYREHGQAMVRRIQGVLFLAKKYGAARVDEACAAALEMGVCEYRFVRRWLERNPQLPLSLRQVDPMIRELTTYRDLIESKIEAQTQPTGEER